MSYGHGLDKTYEKRMVDLGRMKTSSELLLLREACIDAKNHFAEHIWPASLLEPLPTGKDLDARMLAIQAGLKKTINAVWAEKARIAVKTSIKEQHKRGLRNLFGRFKNLDTVGYKPLKTGERRLVNFPDEWSLKLSDVDIQVLKNLSDGMDYKGTIELFRKLKAGKKNHLSELQTKALLAMLAMVEESYGCPEFKTEEATVQLHLDQRCLNGAKVAFDAVTNRLTDLIKVGGKVPFLVSGLKARATPFHFVAEVKPDILKKLVESSSSEPSFTSLAIEIGPTETLIRGVLSQKPKPYTIEEATHILGDDFGFVNTSAQSIVKIDKPLSMAFFEDAKTWTKEQARAYLESHTHDGKAIEHVLHDGKDFLDVIEKHVNHIQRLRSQIDLIYKRFGMIKHEVCRILGVPDDTHLGLENPPPILTDKRLVKLWGKLQKLLKELKPLRRKLYRRIEGIKKSWFGWLSTQKAKLALRYKAIVVREDLTILAKEKCSPGYFGRDFNKMMNNGAKGQYLRSASRKLKWFGIPEVTIPSFYTSSTDVRHAVVDGNQRQGLVFTARVDGERSHSDLHASETMGLYPLLRPKLEPAVLELA